MDAGKLLDICGDWKHYLKQAIKVPEDAFIRHSSIGRPLGDTDFIERAERLLHRDLRKKKPGPKVDSDN